MGEPEAGRYVRHGMADSYTYFGAFCLAPIAFLYGERPRGSGASDPTPEAGRGSVSGSSCGTPLGGGSDVSTSSGAQQVFQAGTDEFRRVARSTGSTRSTSDKEDQP